MVIGGTNSPWLVTISAAYAAALFAIAWFGDRETARGARWSDHPVAPGVLFPLTHMAGRGASPGAAAAAVVILLLAFLAAGARRGVGVGGLRRV